MEKISFHNNWRYEQAPVTIPHDAMLATRRNPQSKGGSAAAFFDGGIYHYEKDFEVPREWEKKHICLQFEGVYKNSSVLVNGREAGGTEYGYLPFFVELDGLLQYGGKNHIEVIADNSEQPESRWYTGGGIYRPVWLWMGEQEYIRPEGVKISTVSYAPAQIAVAIEYEGRAAQAAQIDILDGDRVIKSVSVKTGEGQTMIDLPEAKCWSEDTPYLYECKVTLDNGETAQTTFGIRKVEWSNQGLFINGKNTLLRGGCLHHDNGLLGAAAYEEAEYRRVKKLKEAGYNAIRSSHNPCSAAMLKACDELGVYMMDEAWDMWYFHKNQYDYASQWKENHLSDLKAMVERDYNHPSVIFYSIGNEVSEPAKEEGIRAIREMTDYLHTLDSNRAVTAGFNLMIISNASKGKGIYDEEKGGRKNDNDTKMQGMNSTVFNMIASMVGTGMNKAANSKKADQATTPALDLLDIAGYNYASGRYPMEGTAHPDRVIYGSETFPQDIAKNWEMVKKYPYLIGDFMWTAWDYLGEAGIGAWAYTPDGKGFNKPYPWLLADCGAFDILGNPGAPVALAKAAWGLDEQPWIGVQPVNHPGVKPAKSTWRGSNAMASWSWNGCQGNPAVIEIYSSAASVEVLLNGKSLGKKKLKSCKAVYKTKYREGVLEAIAYDAAGKETGRNRLTSAQGDLKIVTEQEKYGTIVYLNIGIADADGILEANADRELHVQVNNGELLGFGSANPRTEESYQTGNFTTYYGRAQAIVRCKENCSVSITGPGMESVSIIIPER